MTNVQNRRAYTFTLVRTRTLHESAEITVAALETDTVEAARVRLRAYLDANGEPDYLRVEERGDDAEPFDIEDEPGELTELADGEEPNVPLVP